MIKILLILLLIPSLTVSSLAAEIVAPEVPRIGAEQMPENTESFGEAVLEMFQKSEMLFHSAFENALQIGSCIFFITVLFAVLSLLTEGKQITLSIAGAVAVAAIMLQSTNSMICYAADAVQEICEYGKLLCPVLTMSLAAQGGVSASAALYTGTTVFISLMSMLISRVLVPMIYLILVLSVSNCATGEDMLKSISCSVKNVMSWILKTLLIVFTTYMSITGVVSGTTDAAALKAAKVTISTVVPVVGGILSDASESVLVSMGILKNAVGVYGILAVLAVFMGPFVKVGIQYLVLKISAGICGIFGNKNISVLIEDFSTAMGLLLGMVAASSMLVLVSTVCFMKGMG